MASPDPDQGHAAVHTDSMVLQLVELRQLLLLQNALIQEQAQEIIAQQTKASAAQKEIEKRDQRIARLERHSSLKDKNDPQTKVFPREKQGKSHRFDPVAKGAAGSSPSPCPKRDRGLPDYQETTRLYGFSTTPHEAREEVLVPAWREPSLSRHGRLSVGSTPPTTEMLEDYTNEAYERRHRKYEQMERRRKRADREQALIAIQQQEHFGAAQQTTSQATRPFSFFPDPLEHLELIELTDKLPLVAWGQPVPPMRQDMFSLPRSGPYSFDHEVEFVRFRRNSTHQSQPQSRIRQQRQPEILAASSSTSNISLRPR